VLKYSQGIWLSMAERYGIEVTGVCKICEAEGKTEMHHIISQSKIKMIERPELTTNPANIIELCKKCHDLTDSSSYRRWMMESEPNRRRGRKGIPSHLQERMKNEGSFPCAGYTRIGGGRRCRKAVVKEGGYCSTHQYQISLKHEIDD
jgi:hypothetical protein